MVDASGQPVNPDERALADLRQRLAIALATEDWPSAQALGEAALRLAPRDPALQDALRRAQWGEWLSARYQAAREHLQEGRWAEAIAQLDALLAQQHTEYFARATAYQDAAALRQQAQDQLEAEPRLAAWYERGVAALRAGDSQAAADAFREVVKRRAHYRDAPRQLAAALAAIERQRAAGQLRGQTPDAPEPPPTPLPPPVVPRAHVAPPAEEAAPRVMIGRRAVLGALYQQGVNALRRGDPAAAIEALAPVVEEAADDYPDAAAWLAQARVATGGAEGARPRGQAAAGGAGVSESGAAPAATAGAAGGPSSGPAPPTDRPAYARSASNAESGGRPADPPAPGAPAFAPPEHRRGWRLWALGGLLVAVGLVALLVLAGQPSRPPRTDEAAAPSATLVPLADLFARCEQAVAAEDWGDAIPACRRVHARDADYAGLSEKLAAAYVGRGKERLGTAGDLATAESDFGEALRYQSEHEPAKQQLQRLYLYREGDKALRAEDWETAVGTFSAIQADDPEYLAAEGDRAARRKLWAAWLGWGQAALAADDKPSAAQRCAQALQLVPDEPEATRCLNDAGGLPTEGGLPDELPDGFPGELPPGGIPPGALPPGGPPPGALPPR